MCLNCGFYNGRQVLDLKAKADARATRVAARQGMRRAAKGEADAVETTETAK